MKINRTHWLGLAVLGSSPSFITWPRRQAEAGRVDVDLLHYDYAGPQNRKP